MNFKNALLILFLTSGCHDFVADAIIIGDNETELDSDFDLDDSSNSEDTSLDTESDTVSLVDTMALCETSVFDEEEDMTYPDPGIGQWVVNGWQLWMDGFIEGEHVFNDETRIDIEAYGDPVADNWPNMRLYVDDIEIGNASVNSSNIATYPFNIENKTGLLSVKIELTNDWISSTEDINLYIKSITFVCP
jgi:hypothetical protein